MSWKIRKNVFCFIENRENNCKNLIEILLIKIFLFNIFSDSFLSLSSALTVLKQEIPSPFGNDQVKKIGKGSSPLNKDQVDEITQIEQAATIKNGTTTDPNAQNTNGTANNNNNNTNAVGGGGSNANNMACHLNGNSNSSASNDLVNCLDNVGQNQPSPNDPNDERNDSNNLSMYLQAKIKF